MSDELEQFRQEVRQIVHEVLDEMRPQPLPISASDSGTSASAGDPCQSLTEVTVHPWGEVQVRITSAEALAAPGGGGKGRPKPPVSRCIEPRRLTLSARCIEGGTLGDLLEGIEAPSFSLEQENLLARLMRATGLTRPQLLGHLLYRLLLTEAEEYAAELGVTAYGSEGGTSSQSLSAEEGGLVAGEATLGDSEAQERAE